MPTWMDFVTVENTHEMAGNWDRRGRRSAPSSIDCSASDAAASRDETPASLSPLPSLLWRSWTPPKRYRRPIQACFLSKISLFEKIQSLVELLVPACSDALDFQPLEFLQQPPLAVGRQARLGHRKEDIVFLKDVRIQKRAVVARARNHHGRGRAIARAAFLPRRGHLPDEGAAALRAAERR